MTDQKIKFPLGWQQGHEADPAAVVKALALEMLSERSDLQHEVLQFQLDHQNIEAECYQKQADTLEKYATALYAIAVQMDPTGYQAENMSGLIELAAKHQVILPDWMLK